MNKYSIFSLATLVIFIGLFYTMLSGVSLGTFGKPFIISMFLFPLLGVFSGLKAKKGIMKWLLIILNIIAICTIGYISLLANGIAEN
ncbi:hypothetical protein BAG01nite_29460 [Brevibacillus agri]|uniref:Uncharacterized protein n=1 Tax=Brevibacillus agri TaxID=51101 RepID=A0A3M8AH51_9BACL|nr:MULTISPECIES: hypothetical protein [Brevibacillus]ELK42130.1 hypothetical protein D478_10580 [Brevibacillus agri BAB-2500]EJL42232.1 hypothetical protein PMI08_03403 [Brevibacillus sp. CF112]MBG9566319.1 hypothetical protein [Brevibacillus agri]MBY0051593.1 hypothetical protein [Brevibacillus agri]MCG5254866.1 hypothetical protein [Brevibacillus agri]